MLGNGVEKNEIKAFEWYNKSAEQGYFSAKFQLGYCHVNGIGTEVNKEKGFELYDEASGKKKINTQINVNDLDNDSEKVNYWYKKVAGNDNEVALYNLGK